MEGGREGSRAEDDHQVVVPEHEIRAWTSFALVLFCRGTRFQGST